MQTYKRICIKDFEIREGDKIFSIKRGKEYLTSAVNEAPSIICDGAVNGHVVVFSNYWVHVPVEYFAGEIQFTGR